MQVFKIYKDDIKDRMDPIYHRYSKSSILKPNYDFVKLESLLKQKPQYGANERAIEFKDNAVRYIRITDIDEYGNLRDDSLMSVENVDDKYILSDGDILFARSGATAGKALLYRSHMPKSVFAGYLIRFVFDETKVDPEFIFYYTQLSFYKQWVESIQRAAGQPNINSEEFKSLSIPLPPLEKQKEVIEIMSSAYKAKENKEKEAKKLLNGINSYVLEQIGLELPVEKSISTYIVNSDDLRSNRIDPYYYKPIFFAFEKQLKASRYKIEPFSNHIETLINGYDHRSFEESGTPYLKVSNIRPYKIDLKKTFYIDTKSNPISKDILLKSGNLLLTRKGTYGVAVSIKEDNEHVICSEIFKVVLKSNASADFLEIILNSSIGQIQFDRNKIGAIMGSLSQDAVKSILIPVPPKEIQESIIKQVHNILSQVEKLNIEAVELMEKAKEKVETLLFKI